MPLPREYSPQRRAVMTAVMWLILAGTVGLAALATKYPASPEEIRRNQDRHQR